MTRDEAQEAVAMAVNSGIKFRGLNESERLMVNNYINGLVALGLLELDAPKSVEDRAIWAIQHACDLNRWDALNVLKYLAESDLKIVDANKS